MVTFLGLRLIEECQKQRFVVNFVVGKVGNLKENEANGKPGNFTGAVNSKGKVFCYVNTINISFSHLGLLVLMKDIDTNISKSTIIEKQYNCFPLAKKEDSHYEKTLQEIQSKTKIQDKTIG